MPFVSIGGHDVYFETFGEGPALVLTPGSQQSCDAIRPLGEKLAPKYRIILWDRANTGRAEPCFDGTRDIDLWADQLAGLIKHLNIAPAFLAGCSGGARVSYTLAQRHPDCVKAMILWLLTGGAITAAVKQVHYVQFAETAEKDGMAGVAAMPQWAARIALNPDIKTKLLATDPQTFVNAMRRWADALHADDPVLGATAADLGTIKAPVGILKNWDGDGGHPAANQELVAKLIPGARLIDEPAFIDEWATIHASVPRGTGYEAAPSLARIVDAFFTPL